MVTPCYESMGEYYFGRKCYLKQILFIYITFIIIVTIPDEEKKKQIWLSPITKTPIPTENSENNGQHKTPPKTSITQPLRTDFWRSVGITTDIQLVWLNRFTVPNIPTNRKSRLIKRTHIQKFVNNPPYVDWGPTSNQNGEVIKMWYTNMYMYSNIKVYQKYQVTSIKVGCATHSLYASSVPKTDGVPNNKQRLRGSGPCRLWGGLNKARQIVPTAL